MSTEPTILFYLSLCFYGYSFFLTKPRVNEQRKGTLLLTFRTVKFCAAKIDPCQNNFPGLISRGLFLVLYQGKSETAPVGIQNSPLKIKPGKLFWRGAILAAQNLTV